MKEYTIEEINAYRSEVYRILIEKGETEDFARGVCGYDGYIINGEEMPESKVQNSDIIGIWSETVRLTPPELYAEWMTL